MKKCENPLVSEYTKNHRKRVFNLSDLKIPEGLTKVCVWCLGKLKGQQRRWCGKDCVDAASAWSSPQKEYGLGSLLIKQNYKCNICAFDYGVVVESIYQNPKIPYGMAEAKDNWRTKFYYWVVVRLKRHLHQNDPSHRLEVDHIVPIYKGGLPLDLENCQAICYDCHKVKTKIDNSGKRKKT